MNLHRRLRALVALAGALSLGAAVTGVSTAAAAVRPRGTVVRTATTERGTDARPEHEALVGDDVRTIRDGAFEVARAVTGTGSDRRVVFTVVDLRRGRSFSLNEPR
jgi:hypothetical protein